LLLWNASAIVSPVTEETVADRKYFDAEIGIEADDLTLFRSLAKLHGCSVETVADVALRIGAHAIRSGSVRLVLRPDGMAS
jgi:hypothetical protein